MTRTSAASKIMSVTQQSPRRADDVSSWPLPRGEARRLSIGPGARLLRVAEGTVWLTQAGHGDELAEDQWLRAGEQVRLADGSEVVLEGWGEARFQLLVPPDACAGHAAWWDQATSRLSRLTASLTHTRQAVPSDLRYSGL